MSFCFVLLHWRCQSHLKGGGQIIYFFLCSHRLKLNMYCILLCIVFPVTGTGHRCLSANVVTVKENKKKTNLKGGNKNKVALKPMS